MKKLFLLAGIFCCACFRILAATPLTESTFTEIIHEANVVAAADKAVKPAVTNEIFRVPDLVRTGPASRVEMTAPDKTITRIGANTVFTFEPTWRSSVECRVSRANSRNRTLVPAVFLRPTFPRA